MIDVFVYVVIYIGFDSVDIVGGERLKVGFLWVFDGDDVVFDFY